ncbi:MAG: SusC/RagA family TonB-linked outer membrane protein [Candidatus Cryptobacteroides sp.]
MKHYLTTFLALILTFTVMSAQSPELTIDVSGKTMRQCLEAVSAGSGVFFSYDLRTVDTPVLVKGKISGSLPEVLDKLFSGTGIRWEEISSDRIALTREVATSRTPAASVKIKGTVCDGDGVPLPGVAVMENSENATVTDSDGYYELSVTPGGKLIFTCIGYVNVEVRPGTRSVIDVALEEEAIDLEELVVVGYRTVKKISLTGAVATISPKAKEGQPITNTAQMLYNTPGIWVNQSGAQPGQDKASITIRGVNSLNSTGGAPLVLLDGIEYDITEIDPSTIESITVLKDVAAAIYGMKAANGVILVTSKKGSKGRPKVEYKGKFGIQAPTYLPDAVTDPILYMRLRNLAEMNSGVSASAVSYSSDQIYEYMNGMDVDPSIYPSSDWFGICLENGYVQSHSIRLSGGTDRASYGMGFAFTDQKGVFIDNDKAQRYSLDLKLDVNVNSWMKVTGSFQGNIRVFTEPGYGASTVLNTIMRGLPIFSDYHKGENYGSTWLFTPGRNNIENPRMEVEQGSIYRNYQELLSTLGTEISLARHLKYYGTFGFRRIDHFSKNFIPQMYTINPKTGDVKKFNGSAPRVKDWDSVTSQYTLSHRLVWENDYGRNNIHVMAGQDWQHNSARNFQAYNAGFNDNTLTELSALTDYTNAQATGYSTQKRLISVYGRAAYTFDERYMLEATLRYDGSSNLSKANRWHFFPSVMGAWNISRESFFKAGWVDLLRLRASYGVMGSESVSTYSYLMTYAALSQNYTFGGNTSSGYAISELTDSGLGWEKTAATNVGLDFTALGGRLGFEADFFNKRTYDIIMTRTIPSHIGGLAGPKSNVGTVRNRGFEVSGSWRDQRGKFNYAINASASFVKNKVLSLDGGRILGNSNTLITTEGYPIRSYYVYETDGYFQSQEEIDNATAVYGDRSKLVPGYVKYVNQNGDDKIDEEDKIITRNSIPELTYGFGLQFGWNGLSLDAQFQGVGDVYVYLKDNLAVPFNNGAGVTMDWATNSWTPENRNSKLPILTTYTDAPENFIPSTQWLYNCAYLRLKNLQLTYRFPHKVVSKLRLEDLSVYVSAQNLLTFSAFDLWDPEITSTRTNLYEYPNLKSYSIGLNISF